MDQALTLFEQLRAGDYPLLEQIVASQWEESLWLEFKANPDTNRARPEERLTTPEGSLTKIGRQQLAAALSGFANSDGGVLVWGVDCRRNSDQIDAASKLLPLPGLRRFVSEVRSQTAQLVSPPVPGVGHYVVDARDRDDEGFLLTYVPRDEVRLHMARAADQFRFYKRVAGGFFPMEEYEIAAGYARRPSPKLELAWELEGRDMMEECCRIWLRLGIRNVGAALAHYPAMALYNAGGVKIDLEFGPSGNRDPGLPRRPHIQRSREIDGQMVTGYFFAGGPDDVLFPGSTLWVARTQEDQLHLDHFRLIGKMVHCDLLCDGFYMETVTQIDQGEYQRVWNQIRLSSKG